VRTYNNILATFIIGGIWHGAGWTFVFWGFLHGIALVIHRLWKNLGFNMPNILGWFITFNFVNIAWVFFRAKDWTDAMKVLTSMFSLENLCLPNFLESKLLFMHKYGIKFDSYVLSMNYLQEQLFVYLVTVILMVFPIKNTNYYYILKHNSNVYTYFYFTSIIFVFSIYYNLNINSSEFIYFNF